MGELESIEYAESFRKEGLKGFPGAKDIISFPVSPRAGKMPEGRNDAQT